MNTGRFVAVTGCLAMFGGVFAGGCGGGGPRINVALSARNLCQVPVSGESETRCTSDEGCGGGFCWFPEMPVCGGPDDCLQDWSCSDGHCTRSCNAPAECGEGFVCLNGSCSRNGYCRECQSDANCPSGKCDFGHCHATCSTDSDCTETERCTGGLCRRPVVGGTDFNFCNVGDSNLEIYIDKTELMGSDDACAFAKMIWDSTEPTVVLPPDDCSLNLRVEFAPPAPGDYYALIRIHSNDPNPEPTGNPMWIMLYGQAVEAPCNEDIDGACSPCTIRDTDFVVGEGSTELKAQFQSSPSCGG